MGIHEHTWELQVFILGVLEDRSGRDGEMEGERTGRDSWT